MDSSFKEFGEALARVAQLARLVEGLRVQVRGKAAG